MTTTVQESEDGRRFDLLVDGEVAGHADCVPGDGVVAIVHTEVDPAHGGRGLGTTLVRGVLDQLAARGVAVLPRCPFVPVVMQRHPEYAALVPEAERAAYGL